MKKLGLVVALAMLGIGFVSAATNAEVAVYAKIDQVLSVSATSEFGTEAGAFTLDPAGETGVLVSTVTVTSNRKSWQISLDSAKGWLLEGSKIGATENLKFLMESL